MESFDRPDPEPAPVRPRFEVPSASGEGNGHGSGQGRRRESNQVRTRTPTAYRVCEVGTEALIYFMIVFTPWAFGTTEEWSIWTMNVTAYALGLGLAAKWFIRWREGFRPARWGDGEGLIVEPETRAARWTRHATWLLAALTVAMLGYIALSLWNTRAVYLTGQRRFEYFDAIPWLPQTYDAASTWPAFAQYLGLACFFWALRDWLLGKTAAERRRHRDDGLRRSESGEHAVRVAGAMAAPAWADANTARLPARLQRLLWVLCLNGGVLALEAILQRLSGTNRLLWLVQPRINVAAESQFGPYAYRSNAAQYFNLVWPVCLGFWLWLRQSALRQRRIGARIGAGSYVVLLPAAVLMAACPVISTSRGGALVAVGNMLLAMAVLMWALRRESRLMRGTVLGLFLAIAALSGVLGWQRLAARMKTILEDKLSQRAEIYKNAKPIAREFPVFGTGAGTFGSLYQLYRETPGQNWAAYLHDDWLETRVTFGWVGFTALVAMLGLVAARLFGGGGIAAPKEFSALVVIALAGLLLHAKYDFPLQVYSVLFLFLLLCGVMFTQTPARASDA